MTTTLREPTQRDTARIETELELYKRLLHLGEQEDWEAFLEETLALVVELTEAEHGYLEIFPHERDSSRRWFTAHGFTDKEAATVRAHISTGIISRALATGETIVTPSAMLDPEFSNFESVRLSKIEAVLCTPIGSAPCVGAIYVQGRERPGLFDVNERQLVEILARHIAPIASRLLCDQHRRLDNDPTAPYRERFDLDRIIGSSEALATVFEQLSLAVPVDISVLLTGANGTGKSQLARAIHSNGPRAASPFIEINCGALPENLVESELFGALPGAYTGVETKITGKVEAAEGGTLFLDEITELPLSSQAKLLHLLQAKTYYSLGSSEQAKANVRVIAATNSDIEEAVKTKRFREDLFHRINVLHIRAPALAERREDIRPLMRHFCRRACEEDGLARPDISPGAEQAAELAPWTGNVRELYNHVRVAAIRANSQGSTTLEARHLFPESGSREVDREMTFQEATRLFQAGFLRDKLEENNWNITKTASQLDVARSYLYTLINTHGLKR